MKLSVAVALSLALSHFVGSLSGQSCRVMFYNAENLFDTSDDPLTIDETFLPESETHWNNSRLRKKITNLYRVIVEAGGWEAPAVIGLCEIENRTVLEKLVHDTPLRRNHYGIIHSDSPDPRGIDVALLYLKDAFIPDTVIFKNLDPAISGGLKTRDVLYARGRLKWGDTIHIFVNHWPSRRGGEAASTGKRMLCSGLVRQMTDSILSLDPLAGIIVMGDFNDEPWDPSLQNLCRGKVTEAGEVTQGLVNLMLNSGVLLNEGTINHGGFWLVFDQFLVSCPLLEPGNRLHIKEGRAFILSSGYLLEKDPERWTEKPARTYRGPFYAGGYSDHLPVYIELTKNRQFVVPVR